MRKLYVVVLLFLIVSVITGCGRKTQSIVCTYVYQTGENSVAYIKNDNFYMETTKATLHNKGIIKDNKLYIWTDEAITGAIMDSDAQEMIGYIKINGICSQKEINDSLFELPQNKIFQNLE